jgi:ATP synthase F1 delta subunit
MDSLTVNNTYAQAMFDAARERGSEADILEELRDVSAVFKENPKLRKLFLLPTVATKDKKDACRDVFRGQVSQIVLNFLLILIDKQRIYAWTGIVRSYEKLMDEQDGVSKGVLYSVVPIYGKMLKQFEDMCGLELGIVVRLQNRIDTSLIGGVRIYINGKLIDASVKMRLENMKQAMLGL